MQGIPVWFWMVIITGLSIMLVLVLYYLAMLLKESMYTVREVRNTIINLQDVFESVREIAEKAKGIVSKVSGTVDSISESILKPISAISGTLMAFKGFFGGKKNNDDFDEEDYNETTSEY